MIRNEIYQTCQFLGFFRGKNSPETASKFEMTYTLKMCAYCNSSHKANSIRVAISQHACSITHTFQRKCIFLECSHHVKSHKMFTLLLKDVPLFLTLIHLSHSNGTIAQQSLCFSFYGGQRECRKSQLLI